MKTIVGILPWAVVLAVLGGGIWWLLSKGMAAGPWLLAAVLVGHGIVHAMFALPVQAPTEGGTAWPFDMARSWAVTGAGLDLNAVRLVGGVFIAIVVCSFALAALSTVGLVVPTGWWPATVGVSALASAALLILFFEPQLILGLGIDAVLVGVVATRAWVP